MWQAVERLVQPRSFAQWNNDFITILSDQFACPSINPSAHPCSNLPLAHPSIHPSIYLSIDLTACPSVCLSGFQSSTQHLFHVLPDEALVHTKLFLPPDAHTFSCWQSIILWAVARAVVWAMRLWGHAHAEQ